MFFFTNYFSALRVNTPSNSSEEPDVHLWFGRLRKKIKNDNSRDQQDKGYVNVLTQHNYVSKLYSVKLNDFDLLCFHRAV